MANTGYTWGAWGFVQKSAGNWSADALADAATETSDATALDGKAGAIVSITAVEDDTGDIDGDVTVYILGDIDGTNYEDPDEGIPYSFTFTPERNDTVYVQFPIDPRVYDDVKIAVKNDSGQELAITVRYKTCDIPAAS